MTEAETRWAALIPLSTYAPSTLPAMVAKPPVMTAWISDRVMSFKNGRMSNGASVWINGKENVCGFMTCLIMSDTMILERVGLVVENIHCCHKSWNKFLFTSLHKISVIIWFILDRELKGHYYLLRTLLNNKLWLIMSQSFHEKKWAKISFSSSLYYKTTTTTKEDYPKLIEQTERVDELAWFWVRKSWLHDITSLSKTTSIEIDLGLRITESWERHCHRCNKMTGAYPEHYEQGEG